MDREAFDSDLFVHDDSRLAGGGGAMMKAVVLHAADEMRVEQRPVPDPGSGEVLLKINVTSICGTDVKVLHRKLLGQPARRAVGDRVAVEVHKG